MEDNQTEIEKKAKEHKEMLNLMVSSTFARHADLNEEEYLNKIGFKDKGIGEDKAVRVALFNGVIELAKLTLDINSKLKMCNKIMQVFMLDNGIKEEKVGD